MAYLVYWKVASFHHLAAMPRITSTITLGARVCSNVSSDVQVQVHVQVQVCRFRCRCTIATIYNVQCTMFLNKLRHCTVLELKLCSVKYIVHWLETSIRRVT